MSYGVVTVVVALNYSAQIELEFDGIDVCVDLKVVCVLVSGCEYCTVCVCVCAYD